MTAFFLESRWPLLIPRSVHKGIAPILHDRFDGAPSFSNTIWALSKNSFFQVLILGGVKVMFLAQ
jgi:hypothetical protein